MIRLIVGSKGTGKTKTMIEMINNVAKTTHGNVVVIERNMGLTYNIDHSVRLIDLAEYNVFGADALYGFVAGILAGNYDITDVFVDGALKSKLTLEELGNVMDRIDVIAGQDTRVIFSVSAHDDELPENIRKYQ